jgi:3',5'-cyclic AMP phosphodiesterase CpdA
MTPGEHSYDVGGVTGTFHIGPGRNDAAGFTFIVTGDTQAEDEWGFAYSAKTHEEAWKMFPEAVFTAVVGDFTENSDNAGWDMYFNAFAPYNAKTALVPVAGNHDGNLKWNWFRNMFALKEPNNFWSNLTGVYYSFDYGDAHFAVLNTNDMYSMSAAQQNWFLNDMKQSDAKWKIVLTHRPPYTEGSHVNSPDTLPMRRALIPLMDQAGADLVISGHDHIYARTRPMKGDKAAGERADAYTDPAGTLYLLPGAACQKRYEIVENILPSIKEAMVKCEQPGMPIFTGITIKEGKLTYTAYTYNPDTGLSEEYDKLEITKTRFAGADPDYCPKPTNFFLTLPQHLWNFLVVMFGTFADYLFRLLPGMIKG